MLDIPCLCEDMEQLIQVKAGTTSLEIYLVTYMNLCITYDTTISLLGIYPTELCANVQQNTFVSVHRNTSTIRSRQKLPKSHKK